MSVAPGKGVRVPLPSSSRYSRVNLVLPCAPMLFTVGACHHQRLSIGGEGWTAPGVIGLKRQLTRSRVLDRRYPDIIVGIGPTHVGKRLAIGGPGRGVARAEVGGRARPQGVDVEHVLVAFGRGDEGHELAGGGPDQVHNLIAFPGKRVLSRAAFYIIRHVGDQQLSVADVGQELLLPGGRNWGGGRGGFNVRGDLRDEGVRRGRGDEGRRRQGIIGGRGCGCLICPGRQWEAGHRNQEHDKIISKQGGLSFHFIFISSQNWNAIPGGCPGLRINSKCRGWR